MILSKLQPLRHFSRRLHRSLTVPSAVRQDTTLWISTPLLKVLPAAESIFNITIDVSESPELAASYKKPGQYLQLRLQDSESKPSFLAIASPPSIAVKGGVFEFLVKSVAGSTAELLCGLQKGDIVELTPAMGKGFDLDQISPPEDYQTVIIFATGSGIIPIRSLIEAGFDAVKRSDVRLYYGARNLNWMAYQERFKNWESSGVSIVPVLSKPDDSWIGEQGYVQAAFARNKRISNPQSTGVVQVCNRWLRYVNFRYARLFTVTILKSNFDLDEQEELTAVLVADGVSTEKILKNFLIFINLHIIIPSFFSSN